MPHTYAQNIVHLVFSTKDRRKVISEEFRAELWAYIAGICKKHGVFVHAIGGVEDHIHLLVVVPAPLSVADAVRAIKANSSRWMGERNPRFAWQQGYAAFSVSASNVAAVVRYIRGQEGHHRKMTFEAELVALLRKHGVGFNPKFVFG